MDNRKLFVYKKNRQGYDGDFMAFKLTHQSQVDYAPEIRLLDCCVLQLTRWRHIAQRLVMPYWRLYWNKQPGAYVIFKGKRYDLTPDIMMAIPPQTPFDSFLRHPVRHHVIHFMCAYPFDRLAPQIIRFHAPPDLKRIFRSLEDFEHSEPLRRAILSTRAFFLCYYALSQISPDKINALTPNPRMQQAIQQINAYLEEPLSNHALARAAGMNVTGFLRLFKQATGQSPHVYYLTRRIERAVLLLRFSKDSLDAIAAATGFCDRYHFSRVFKHVRGESPAHFRNEFR